MLRTPARHALTALWSLLALTLPAAAAYAQTDKPGLFEVRSASAELDGGVYLLDARLQYILSGEALAALDNGVPLDITIDIEVIEQRRFLPDNTVATLAVRYQLQYHALSQRYLVQNLNTGEQESFATLYSALNNLGRVTGLPIIDAALLDPDRRHRMRIRSALEFRNISGPLRMLAFWLDDSDIRSDWYEWTLDRSAE